MFGTSHDPGADALEILKRDHDEVETLFDRYQSAREESNGELKEQLVAAVCKALTLHADIEEALFYPALRRADRGAADLLDEAFVEHQSLRAFVNDLASALPDEPFYDARVKVLSEYVKHHVKEEEGELFPLARQSGLDLNALGRALLEHRGREAQPRPAPEAPQRTARGREDKPLVAASPRAAVKGAGRKTASAGGRH